MSQSIQEYLVSLNFNADDQSYRKFKNYMESTTKSFKGLGEASLATAGVLGTAVIAAASKMDGLYHAAQRTGASVGELEAFTFGMKQIGVSAEQSQGAVEALADALRTPGFADQLRLLGVNVSSDNVKNLTQLFEKMNTKPFYQAKGYLNSYGIDEHIYLAWRQNQADFIKGMKDREAFDKRLGLSQEEVARRSHEVNNEMNLFKEELEDIAVVGLSKFMPFLQGILDDGVKIVTWLADVDKATSGWSSALLEVVAALGALKTAGAVIGLGGRILAAGGAGAAATEGAEAGALGGPVGAVLGGVLAVGGYEAIKNHKALEEWFAKTFPSNGWGTVAGHNPGNMRAWDRGHEDYFSRGSSGQFVAFKSDFEGLSAMAGQLLKYSAQNIDTVQGIINKYAPAGDHNNTGAYSSDVAKRLGVGAGDHLNLSDPTTLEKLMAAMINHEQGFQPYSADQLDQAAQYRLGKSSGGAGVVMNQQTEIHNHGVSDPQAAGRAAGDQQARVNGDMIRNLQGAVQ